jgi:hypothetical protein
MVGASNWADVTLSDAIATQPQNVNAASLNGKLFLAYDTTVDRLHVWDPDLGSPRVRRVGFADPGAPTVANTGAGAYAAILRYYRVRWIQLNGSVVARRSEPGASTSFTPSGVGAAARVTQPTVPSEQETHWEVEVSLDNVTFYRLSQVAIGTTTYDDSAATSTYQNNPQSADTGEYENWTSVRYLLSDGNRLLGAGAWETAGARNSRVWYSPVLGTTDEGDDERVPNTTVQKNFIDLNENDGGIITGMGGPIYGSPFIFKYRQIWKLIPTGDNLRPYLSRKISDAYGCIAHKSIVSAADSTGNPALYFLSAAGPCRIISSPGGAAVVQYLGRDVEDLWSTANLSASTVVAHGVYYALKHQIWFWFATGSSNDPDTKIVFDMHLGRVTEAGLVRGGWYRHSGPSAAARCSVATANDIGVNPGRTVIPVIGRASGTAVWRLDTSQTNDAGTAFQAYITTRPIRLDSLAQNVQVGQSVLVARAQSSVTITQRLSRNYGAETRDSTVVLTADGSETRVIRKFEASDLAQAAAIQIQLGETSATDQALWSLDALEVPITVQEDL